MMLKYLNELIPELVDLHLRYGEILRPICLGNRALGVEYPLTRCLGLVEDSLPLLHGDVAVDFFL